MSSSRSLNDTDAVSDTDLGDFRWLMKIALLLGVPLGIRRACVRPPEISGADRRLETRNRCKSA